LSAQIFAEEKLYDGGIYGLKTKQMQIDLQSLGIARKISERDIVFSVKQAFIEILRAREEITAAAAEPVAARRLLRSP